MKSMRIDIVTFVKSIIDIGTSRAPVEDRKAIQIINVLGIVTGLMVYAVGFIFYSILPNRLLLYGVLFEGSSFIALVVLNYFGKSQISKYAVLGIHCFGAVYFGALLGMVLPTMLVAAFLFVFLVGGTTLIFRNSLNKWCSIGVVAIVMCITELNNYYDVIKPLPLGNHHNYYIFRWLSNAGILALMLGVIWLLARAVEGYDKARRKFLADTTHEIGNALNPISQSIQRLERYIKQLDSPEHMAIFEQYIKRAKPAMSYAKLMIDSVISLAKIENGIYELECKPFLVLPWVGSVIDMLSPNAEEKGQIIRLKYHDLRPIINADRLMLTQILGNLISNASKYGANNTAITVTLSNIDRWGLKIAVHNLGYIPPEVRVNLFERYVTTKGGYERGSGTEGNGIGLDIVRTAVGRLGGKIEVASTMENGTTFSVQIFDVVDQRQELLVTLDDEKPVTHSFDDKTILIIDDNLDTYNSVRILTRGCKLYKAIDGEAGLAKAQELVPDLILIDKTMEKMDGMEVLQHIKNDSKLKSIPVVVVTGSVYEKDKFLSAGCKDFLSKPLDHKQLELILLKNLK
ncbi:hybrid sensor histidine kinase/response regulator [Chitinophaga sp. G-6-1-13]|uniref:histidine kinase n=1 Tax=Chitinophaga fulva TaxID=2728842 RepID=A0A848GPU2_9BACT|nr:hybrid sensor histidine kinase/response regulator [Chitinophaga fulva]NML38660.1 hybrid sensor histidine kinase/response regulator [Chitinophaga fulva]